MNGQTSKPDRRELRRFALLLGGLIALLFGVLFPYLADRPYPWWPWGVLALLALMAVFATPLLRPVHAGWMFLGEKLGWLNTRILLGLIFYLVVLPVGLLMRLSGKDPLALRPDPDADSYRSRLYRFSRDRLKRPF